MSRKSTKTIYYNQDITFPHINWKIEGNFPRTEINKICEQLHAIMLEREGASFYYPDTTNNSVICRYEWFHTWKRWKYGIHLGLIIRIMNDDIKEISAYLTTNEAIEDNSIVLPHFRNNFINKIKDITLNTVLDAISRLAFESQKENYYLFYIKSDMGSNVIFETEDKRIRVFPTSLVQDKAVSPVCVTVKASSKENGRPKALQDLSLFCAIFSLANGILCQPTQLNWGKRKRNIDYLDNPADFDPERHYPTRHYKPSMIFDSNISKRVNLVWKLYHDLAEEYQLQFISPLFAYYSAQNINYKYSTLAIVAYIAALSSLSETTKCPGQISCSQCGLLAMKHNKVGDKAAILALIKDLLEPTSEQEIRLQNIIDRIYRKQRSAFIHGAELRHEEFYQGVGLPRAFPTEKEPVRKIFYYRLDFLSMELITRRTLLSWLSRKNDVNFNLEIFNFKESPIEVRSGAECVFAVPNVWVKPFHNGCRE